MITYILQLTFFQLCFLVLYELFLKKETFFSYNRWYLLLTPLVALFLPLLKLDFLASAFPQSTGLLLPEVLLNTGNSQGIALPPVILSKKDTVSINWWLVVYGIGIGFSVFLFIKKYSNLQRLFRFQKISEGKKFRIIEVPNSSMACTFFNTIFLGDQLSAQEKKHILSHELVHVYQKHSADLFLFEVLRIVLWFNPLIYLYQKRIAGLHEYIADMEVVKRTPKKDYYRQLLNSAFQTQQISFINQFFSHSLLKKRILMLQKTRSKTIAKAKYLLLLPLLAGMLFYTSCESDSETNENGSEVLSQYTYSLKNPEDLKGSKEATHKKYEAFLKSHPNYVSWAEINHNTGEITYSIHPKEEEVPTGFTKLEVNSARGETYVMFMNLNTPTSPPAPATPPTPPVKSEVTDNGNAVPYSVIEEVPTFEGCENAASNEERKHCTSQKITQFVNDNFDVSLAKKLGLKGTTRILVQFKINENGEVVNVKARAPKPELETEAERVIQQIPKMIPGKQDGHVISAMYSLPIVFQVDR